jgi:hypothetical protein
MADMGGINLNRKVDVQTTRPKWKDEQDLKDGKDWLDPLR